MNVSTKQLQNTLTDMGYEKLRPWQEEVFAAAAAGRDILLLSGTGSGKTLIYALLAKLGTGLTIVISPYRALQEDQVHALSTMGLCTAHLNSDQSLAERQSILDALAQLDLLLLAPEQLTKSDVLHALRTQCVARVVVDEAHLIPQAGKQFRPAYGDISSFLSALPTPPQVLACTATATKQEQKHILKSLNMQHPKVFSFFTQRKELALSIKQVGGKERDKQLQALFHAVEQELCSWDGNGAAVIYCPTVSRVKELARWLKGRGFPVLKYTGKQSRKKRQRAQDRFFQGDRKIMVATNAFGTGIDKPDIRLLIHAGLPLSFSGYVQEIGRAGRDGKPSRCVLLSTASDRALNKKILRHSKADTEALEDFKALLTFSSKKACLWQQIEARYGKKKQPPCGQCCNCLQKKK